MNISRFVPHIVLSILVHSSMAFADKTPANDAADRARHHFEAGRGYYAEGRFEDAAREFLEAYRLSERAHLLKNVATALQQANQYIEAITILEEYLQKEPHAEDKVVIQSRIDTLRALASASAKAAEVPTPLQTPPQPQAPEPPPSVAVAPIPPPPESHPGALTIGVLAGAGGSGALALMTGLVAHGKYGDLDSQCSSGSCPSSLEGTRDSGRTLAIVSTAFTGVAIALAITGVFLWVGEGSENAP
ncbi:MAG: hypothetical protein HY791_21240 [Deltaproteobacteria bacterium]|nr:hypothetical protein [Deltaproteobacteria bacterium]